MESDECKNKGVYYTPSIIDVRPRLAALVINGIFTHARL